VQREVDLSIVIPSLNGGIIFTECLDAIFSQETKLTFEVIVLDSGSTDGTLELVKEFPIRLYEIEQGEFNHGETRNKGIGLARGKHVILMTQDAVPTDSGWINAMIKPFKEDPLVAGVYARQVPRGDAHVLTKRHLDEWLTGRTERHISRITERKEYEKMRPMQKYFFCNFDDVCSAIRVSVWNKIPYVKTDFAEDLVWSKKVLEAGYKIVYESKAVVRHSHSRSLGYEYRRTRLCHRRLNEIFGVRTVPTKKRLIRYALKSMKKDIGYIWSSEPSLWKKIFFSARAPLASFLNVYAQYSGAKDAINGRKRSNKEEV